MVNILDYNIVVRNIIVKSSTFIIVDLLKQTIVADWLIGTVMNRLGIRNCFEQFLGNTIGLARHLQLISLIPVIKLEK